MLTVDDVPSWCCVADLAGVVFMLLVNNIGSWCVYIAGVVPVI